ncbi:MAG: hypothetical protein J6T55_04265 [Alphaproteobacteria bacterium]|nr:hypothetical protein [Alphaproteobacteria bacterium]
MADSQNTLLEAFKNRQADKNIAVAQEALRLVNLYRSLSCFGSDFVDKYNQMLLASSPAVRRLLRTFMGGEEVEEYLEFLQQNSHFSEVKSEANKSEENLNKGYLPGPESDSVTKDAYQKETVSKSDLEKMNEEQRKLKEQVQQILNELAKNKYSNLSTKAPAISSFDRYSDITDDSVEEKTHE